MEICVHCKERPGNRLRGLCVRCYYNLDVRKLYPSTSKFARRGAPQPKNVKPASAPTEAPPHSKEKILVLEQRALAGENLWHDRDGCRAAA